MSMIYVKNDEGYFYHMNSEAIRSSLQRLYNISTNNPTVLQPFKGNDEKAVSTLVHENAGNDIDINRNSNGKNAVINDNFALPFRFERIPFFIIDGFYLLPTVKRTTLLYDRMADCFIKILHPLSVKAKVVSFFINRARSVYLTSEDLRSKGLKIPKVLAYGMFTKGRGALIVTERVEGSSLHELLIKEKKTLSDELYVNIINELAKLHNTGYWFGDLRAAHIFIRGQDMSGFVDIDSIRRNKPYRLRNIAKDLAGLNHPAMPLGKDHRKRLFDHYISKSQVSDKDRLLRSIKKYTERRWVSTN